MNLPCVSDFRHPARWADGALGCLFISSRFSKAVSPEVAVDGVNALVGAAELSLVLIMLVVLLEVIVGASLLLIGGWVHRAAGLILLVAFTASLVTLKWAAPGTPCGCAGARGVPGLSEFVRNGLLAAGAALLLISGPASFSPSDRKGRLEEASSFLAGRLGDGGWWYAQPALATDCCLEVDGNCPPVHGPGGVTPGINCSYGVCCVGAGSNAALVRQCCLFGRCIFSETRNGQIMVNCNGTVPWGTVPW